MCRGFTQHHFVNMTRTQPIKTLGNIELKYKLHLHRQSGAGFTLIELLIVIAITGILTAMMFSDFSKEKDRNAIKAAVHQLQTDIQAMQTNAQGGVVTGGVVPKGYGVYLNKSQSYYLLFADLDNFGWKSLTGDTKLQQRALPAGVNITGLEIYSDMNIVFTSPNGNAALAATGGGAISVVTVTIKSDKLSICYAITVTANVGTVSQRRLDTCP